MNPYPPPQQYPQAPPQEEGVEGERGYKTMIAGASVVGMGAGVSKKKILMGAVAAGVAGYVINKKRKKKIKQRQVMPDGTTRDVLVEVDCDPNDPEGYDVDEYGKPLSPAPQQQYAPQQQFQQPPMHQQPMHQPMYQQQQQQFGAPQYYSAPPTAGAFPPPAANNGGYNPNQQYY
eukprot:Awhi_evm1s11115